MNGDNTLVYQKSRQNRRQSGARAPTDFSSSGEGGKKRKGKQPPAGWIAAFWPLAVVPGLAVTLCMERAVGADQAGNGFAARIPVLAGIATAFLLNSLLTIWFYKVDKQQAERQLRRIPEFHLHFWEVLGGWPGALIAQRKYHHKWKKTSYMIIFWLYVVLNLLAVWYLICPDAMKSGAAEGLDSMLRLLNGKA